MVTLPVYGYIENTRTGQLLDFLFLLPPGWSVLLRGSHLSYPMEGITCAASKTAASPVPTLTQHMLLPSKATRCGKPGYRKEHPSLCSLHNVPFFPSLCWVCVEFISHLSILSPVIFCFAGESFGPQSESAGTTDASFSLQDVLEKRIYYFQSVHESIEPTSDVFSFYVSDGFSQSEVQSINITIQVWQLPEPSPFTQTLVKGKPYSFLFNM